MQTELKYIELKTGYSDDGPAWIACLAFSKTGRTVYFNGRELQRWNGIYGNHVDTQSGEEYWISGVMKSGANRHPCGCGKIMVQRDMLAEFLAWTGQDALDNRLYEVVDP